MSEKTVTDQITRLSTYFKNRVIRLLIIFSGATVMTLSKKTDQRIVFDIVLRFWCHIISIFQNLSKNAKIFGSYVSIIKIYFGRKIMLVFFAPWLKFSKIQLFYKLEI
jgi:hypothetical protein